MYDFPVKDSYTLDDLKRLTGILRAPDGCPWDHVQTHQSIRRDFLEETYEVIEGIDRDDPVLMREELDDVLFQVVFHAVIEEERGRFTLSDVITDVTRKMLIRHPHVFAGVKADSEAEVLTNWEQIKNESKGVKTASETLKLVPETFPALMKADKLLKRADKAGAEASEKLAGTLPEAVHAFETADKDAASAALGQLLMAVTAAAREKGVDPEMSLLEACKVFVARFEEAESKADSEGRPISEML